MMNPEPTKQHQWLQQLVGEWTYEHECPGEEGQPPKKLRGTQSTRSIGGLWIHAEGKGEMPDGKPATMFLTVGYDPQQGRFVGTWIGSMMSNLWVYDGWLDDSGRTLILEAKGPSFAEPGKTETYQDRIEIRSPGEHVLTSQMRLPDGSWQRFMTAVYTRVK
jgi:hypothetical protein